MGSGHGRAFDEVGHCLLRSWLPDVKCDLLLMEGAERDRERQRETERNRGNEGKRKGRRDREEEAVLFSLRACRPLCYLFDISALDRYAFLKNCRENIISFTHQLQAISLFLV